MTSAVRPLVCLSSVSLRRLSLLRRTHRLTFSTLFVRCNTFGTRTVCIEILQKEVKGGRAIYMGGDTNNWRFPTNISLNFENGKIYGHSYNGRRIGTCRLFGGFLALVTTY